MMYDNKDKVPPTTDRMTSPFSPTAAQDDDVSSACEITPLLLSENGRSESLAEECPVSASRDDNVENANNNGGNSGGGYAPLHAPSVSHKGTIGMLGGVSIIVNSLTGPAMLELPALYQRSGFVPTTATLIFVCVLSALCSMHMANVISSVPGNHNFQREVEFSESFRIFWGEKAFMFTEIAFFLCISCMNIASITDNAQVVDMLLTNCGISAAAVRFVPRPIRVVTWDPDTCSLEQRTEGSCLPFNRTEDGTLLLSAGYIISALLFVPLGLMDLKENTTWQIVAFIVLVVISIQFIISFIADGLDLNNVSMWGDSWDTLFGVVLFNFALTLIVPAWLYDKSPKVGVGTAIFGSSILSTILYVLIGGLGALAVPNVSGNMLQSMMSGIFGRTTELTAQIFAFFIIGLSIPLFSVLTRLNLTGSGLCSRPVANILAVWFPWGVSWMLYQGIAVTELLSWGGVLFTSLVAFLLPLLIALHAARNFDTEGSVLVYGGFLKTRRTREISLYVLLALTCISVVFAIVGQFFLS